ncbi:hypothetical protein [Methylobacterium nigriterrae]|uniref:hypothetical protein n=1 Tax=Methylobacterium nigriterrae TaxID=3127512 RepID=UPI0030136120
MFVALAMKAGRLSQQRLSLLLKGLRDIKLALALEESRRGAQLESDGLINQGRRLKVGRETRQRSLLSAVQAR